MKKLWLLTLALLGVVGVARADFFDQDKGVVRYRLSVAANTSTAAVVIDLSDDSNFPHDGTRELDLSTIRLSLDKVAASTVTVKMGVVNFVNSSTGSVTWFYTKEQLLNVSNTDIDDDNDYRPNYHRLRVNPASTVDTDGSTPFILSNDTTSGSTTYQNDVRLPATLSAGVIPGVGDLILFVSNGTGTVVVNVEIQYHASNR